MDGIIVLFILWLISKALKKAGKGGQKAAKTAKKMADMTGVSDAEKVIGEAVRRAKMYRAQTGPAQPAQPAQDVPGPDISWLLEEEDCGGVTDSHGHKEGASHADDTGCVGGSLAHDSHEGIGKGGSTGAGRMEGVGRPGSLAASRTDGPGNLAAAGNAAVSGPGNLASRAKPENAPMQGPAQKARFTAADMRRAVVTGEILGKPVALRAKTAGRN